MFDSIVEIEVGEIEGVLAITRAPVQHIGSVVRYEEAETWCEVEGRSDKRANVFELDILAITGEHALSL